MPVRGPQEAEGDCEVAGRAKEEETKAGEGRGGGEESCERDDV